MPEAHALAQLAETRQKLRELIVADLALEDTSADDIDDDEPLFGDGLGLDSLDAIELVVILQRNFDVEVRDREMAERIFTSINVLADYIHEATQNK
ncbi:MAG: acyl carrier protein [Deltaproteobacteria bacterium]|nr:acyl carrier protein [Deltaproteobacteria bacterium]